MSADPDHDLLRTLFLPWREGWLAWPQSGGALFLNARAGGGLQPQDWPGLQCVSAFKPAFDALQAAGFAVRAEAGAERYPLVMLLPPRSREAARAAFAQAMSLLEPGGVLVACQANEEGARSGEADLQRLVGPLQVRSKHRCRVYWSAPDASLDANLQEQWRALVTPRVVAAHGLLSHPGVFSWDRVDVASGLLAQHLPEDLRGHAADLGCGYGYLSRALLAHCPGVVALDAIEADAAALALARANLEPFAATHALDFLWHDVARGLSRRYDCIVSNPPFHAEGRADRPDIGRQFIAAAAAALRPGGQLWLVANRHLPYEAALATHFAQVRCVAQAHGFKVITARHAGVGAGS